ncbi:hypothetical protein MX652_14070 [Thauera aromatica]|nr:hypothetical protein [Thauera aromatica]MCK2127811.1 hypothetical protein [Thauera aromatica]
MYKTLPIPTRVCICDRCGRVMPPDDHDEYQERLSIDFRAGYGSVFGDGNQVQLDLCQHCVRKVLGRWLRVSDQACDEVPYRACQPYQMPARGGLTSLRRRFAHELRHSEGGRRDAQEQDMNRETHHD